MSTINKKPFIKTLLESLTSEQLTALAALIDGGGNQTAILRTLSIEPAGSRTNFTNDDKGVKLCNLEINYSLFNGYLLFNDSYCVLISFTDSPRLMILKISDDKHNFVTVDEDLSALELRTALYEAANGSVAADVIDAINATY